MDVNKFSPGERLIAISEYNNPDDPFNIIKKGEIYTCVKTKPSQMCVSKIRVYVKGCRAGFDSGYFKSVEKEMFDKEYNIKLERLLND